MDFVQHVFNGMHNSSCVGWKLSQSGGHFTVTTIVTMTFKKTNLILFLPSLLLQNPLEDWQSTSAYVPTKAYEEANIAHEHKSMYAKMVTDLRHPLVLN
jgi:hypothetical protein